MEIFEVLADPVRRHIVELLAGGPRTAGEIGEEFDISRPAVSRHLRVLRESGVLSCRPEAQRRVYSLSPASFEAAEAWIDRCRRTWEKHLDALELELQNPPNRRKTRERTRKDRKPR